MSEKKNIVAHLERWIDEDGNLRQMITTCTFAQTMGTALCGDWVHTSYYHGLVSKTELEGINGEIQVFQTRNLHRKLKSN